jgi:hypothetical protein
MRETWPTINRKGKAVRRFFRNVRWIIEAKNEARTLPVEYSFHRGWIGWYDEDFKRAVQERLSNKGKSIVPALLACGALSSY